MEVLVFNQLWQPLCCLSGVFLTLLTGSGYSYGFMFLLALFTSSVTAMIARQKNRSRIFWAVMGGLFFLPSAMVLVFMDNLRRPCLRCGELIPSGAVVCMYCKQDII
jgi:hypothetical protein